jgi:hypothetical protein
MFLLARHSAMRTERAVFGCDNIVSNEFALDDFSCSRELLWSFRL